MILQEPAICDQLSCIQLRRFGKYWVYPGTRNTRSLQVSASRRPLGMTVKINTLFPKQSLFHAHDWKGHAISDWDLDIF